jgi:hypothetical protein
MDQFDLLVDGEWLLCEVGEETTCQCCRRCAGLPLEIACYRLGTSESKILEETGKVE